MIIAFRLGAQDDDIFANSAADRKEHQIFLRDVFLATQTPLSLVEDY